MANLLLRNSMVLNYIICFVLLVMYREYSNIQLLYFCGGITIFFHFSHFAFLLNKSKRKVYIKSSIFDDLLGMGFFAIVGVILIYFDVSFINRGKAYDENIFYPLLQTSLLQGFTSLIFLTIYLVFEKHIANK